MNDSLQTSETFSRRIFRSSRPGNILGADTAYIKDLAAFNDGVNELLVIVDWYFRILIVKPLQAITSKHVNQAFVEILSELVWPTLRLVTDEGSEFINKSLKRYLATKNIRQYSTYNRIIKASPAERVIRTLKLKLYKFMHHNKSRRYIDHLQDIVYSYNISIHSSLVGHTPFDVYLLHDPLEISDLLVKMYKKNRCAIKKCSSPLTIGQHVRLQASDHTLSSFPRGHSPKFTGEIFKITRANVEHHPITYQMTGLDTSEPIRGNFYRQELSPCNAPEVFNVHVIKKRKRRGTSELYVAYTDYPESLMCGLENRILLRNDENKY